VGERPRRLGPVVFIAGYALAAVAFVPGSILTLAAGAIFGLGWGTLYVYIAATIGSSAAFLVSRHLARAVIEKKIAGTCASLRSIAPSARRGRSSSSSCASRRSFPSTCSITPSA